MTRAAFRLVSDQVRSNGEHKSCAQCGKDFARDTRYSRRYFERQKYCCQSCAGEAWRERSAKERPSIQAAFMAGYEQGAEDDCWEWRLSRDKDGYGVFCYGYRTYKAHRMSLENSGVSVPKGTPVCHTCDNPRCVNPRHLYVGTAQSNVHDKISRGRQPVGSAIHVAKLTEKDVAHIRASSESDAALSKIYGVSRSAVSMARSGRTWRHVQ